MPSGKGKIVLMGSGELTATMVEVHKNLLDYLPGSPKAAFLNTPAGFQLNVDQISQKAVLPDPLVVVIDKNKQRTSHSDI